MPPVPALGTKLRFGGENFEGQPQKPKMELERIIRKDEDSVIFYNLRTAKYSAREIMDLEKRWSGEHHLRNHASRNVVDL